MKSVFTKVEIGKSCYLGIDEEFDDDLCVVSLFEITAGETENIFYVIVNNIEVDGEGVTLCFKKNATDRDDQSRMIWFGENAYVNVRAVLVTLDDGRKVIDVFMKTGR